ncbi:MAG: hypothetical protein ACLUAR_00050 [Pilosibacter sp.]
MQPEYQPSDHRYLRSPDLSSWTRCFLWRATIGIMERIVVELVIKIGRRRVAPASTRAVLRSMGQPVLVDRIHIKDTVIYDCTN